MQEFSVNPTNIEFLQLARVPSATEYISFNVTERNKSYFGADLPYFSSSTNTVKTITSNLSQSITANVVVSPAPEWNNCDNINKIRYTPNGGSPIDWTNNDARTVCRALISTGYPLQLNALSNQLQFTFATTSLQSNIINNLLVGMIALSAVVFIVFVILKIKNDYSSMDMQKIIGWIIAAFLFTIAAIILISFALEVG